LIETPAFLNFWAAVFLFDDTRRQKHMAATSDTKPAKLFPEYPLFAHQNRQLAKKIKGKHGTSGHGLIQMPH